MQTDMEEENEWGGESEEEKKGEIDGDKVFTIDEDWKRKSNRKGANLFPIYRICRRKRDHGNWKVYLLFCYGQNGLWGAIAIK